jgi:antitoxin PrlF
MSATSKITERGQTTIPTKIREQLRAKPGDTLEYDITPSGVTIRVKKPDIREVLRKHARSLSAFQSDADVVAAQRERRGWDEHDLRLLEGNTNEDAP